MAARATRTVLITGANRGLGRGTVERLLAESPECQVIMTARRAEEGQKALSEINRLGNYQGRLFFYPLDITSATSITQLKDHIRTTFGALDVLVNNAGIFFKGWDPTEEVARNTVATNYTATVNITEEMLSVMRPGGHIVTVTSWLGMLNQVSGGLRAQLTDKSLTPEGVHALARSYVQSVADGSASRKGWPRDPYFASKVLLNTYVKVRAPQLVSQNIRMNALCPGWVKTDMGGQEGNLSIREGAAMPVMLINDQSQGTGQFWRERRVSSW